MGDMFESRLAPPLYRRTRIVTLSESSKREMVDKLGFRDDWVDVVAPVLLSIPAYRAEAARESEIGFMETASGMPAAVKVWWQEGSTRGYEFIYPKTQVDRLSRGVPPAPTVSTARPSATADVAIASEPSALPGFAEADLPGFAEADAGATTEEIADAPGAAQAPDRQGQLVQPAPAPLSAQEPTPQSTDQGTREELPRTATLLPLAVVMGTLMLFGGGWLARKGRS
jgi:hypothetical protein